MRLEELVKEQALKREKELQLKFDLERFKIESGFRVNDESNDSTNACSVTSNLNLKKLIPDFDPKQSDISLYLVIFERQAKRASIEKKEWVGQLLGLLPPRDRAIYCSRTGGTSRKLRLCKEIIT
ncbi:hypothetical protein TNCV_3001181 [Trichonephila clavipes]|nr:hypothetical protein TNCV_3001181 [Trichonephila clavipes]